MPKKIQHCVMGDLISVPLPNHAASYTTISHQFVIDYSKQQLLAAGFVIVDEEYRSTADGQIAQGIYKLHYNSDPELSMMFAWTNSYNKQVKFKCLIGAYINKTDTVMVSGDISTWTRKHTGTADVETQQTIDAQISNAHMYYNQLVHDKYTMENVSLNKRRQAQMLGILFAEYQILTTEQASMIRQQMDKPSHVYVSTDSLWTFYCYVTLALQVSHPKTWMEDQRILHYFMSTVGNFTPVPVVIPTVEEVIVDELENNYGEPENQTNLLVQIAEVTGDDSILLPQGISAELYHGMNELIEADAKMLMFGDESGYKHIQEVHEKATQDQIIYGISGIRVDENGSHHVPIEEVLQKMQEKEVLQLADNQVVQEEVEIEPVVHQSEEMIVDEEVVYTDTVGNTFKVPVPPCAGHAFESEESFDLIFDEEESEDENIPDFF